MKRTRDPVGPMAAHHVWTVAPGAGSGSGSGTGTGTNTGTGTGTNTDGDASPTGPMAQGPRGGCAAVPGETSWLLAALALLGSAVRRRRAR